MNKLLTAVAVVAAVSFNTSSAQTLEECRASQQIFSGVSCEGLKPEVKVQSPYEECLEAQTIFSGLDCVDLSRYKPSECAIFSMSDLTLTISDVTISNNGEFVDWEDVRLKLGDDGKLTLESFKEAE